MEYYEKILREVHEGVKDRINTHYNVIEIQEEALDISLGFLESIIKTATSNLDTGQSIAILRKIREIYFKTIMENGSVIHKRLTKGALEKLLQLGSRFAHKHKIRENNVHMYISKHIQEFISAIDVVVDFDCKEITKLNVVYAFNKERLDTIFEGFLPKIIELEKEGLAYFKRPNFENIDKIVVINNENIDFNLKNVLRTAKTPKVKKDAPQEDLSLRPKTNVRLGQLYQMAKEQYPEIVRNIKFVDNLGFAVIFNNIPILITTKGIIRTDFNVKIMEIPPRESYYIYLNRFFNLQKSNLKKEEIGFMLRALLLADDHRVRVSLDNVIRTKK